MHFHQIHFIRISKDPTSWFPLSMWQTMKDHWVSVVLIVPIFPLPGQVPLGHGTFSDAPWTFPIKTHGKCRTFEGFAEQFWSSFLPFSSIDRVRWDRCKFNNSNSPGRCPQTASPFKAVHFQNCRKTGWKPGFVPHKGNLVVERMKRDSAVLLPFWRDMLPVGLPGSFNQSIPNSITSLTLGSDIPRAPKDPLWQLRNTSPTNS